MYKGLEGETVTASAGEQEFPPTGQPWPEGGLESVGECPVCNSTERKIMYEGLHDQIFFCAPGTWTLYRCTACGSGYLDPRPTRQTIGLAYGQYLTHFDGKRELRGLNAVQRLRRIIGNGYLNARFGTRFSPSSRLGNWVFPVFSGPRAVLEAEGRHLPKPAPGATLLDIGCGSGSFLEIAAAMGWHATGLEPDPKAVEVCRSRGLRVYQGDISALDIAPESYDVITMGHVVEHVHDPRDLLAGCFRLLKPGGVLWIETPNLGSIGGRCYGRNWRGLEPPRHLVLFTWDSLQAILTESGFRKIVPAPARPLAYWTFPASRAIARGENPRGFANRWRLGLRLRAWQADSRGRRDLTCREFITLSAEKPKRVSNSSRT